METALPSLPGRVGSQVWAVLAALGSGMFPFPFCPEPCCPGLWSWAQVNECGWLSWEIEHVPFLDEWADLYGSGWRSSNLWVSLSKAVV